MKGKHIIQAVNFNNGEALDLQTLSERLKADRLENSEIDNILGGASCWGTQVCTKIPCPDKGCNGETCSTYGSCNSECAYDGCT